MVIFCKKGGREGEKRKRKHSWIPGFGKVPLQQPVACPRTLISLRDHDTEPLQTGQEWELSVEK